MTRAATLREETRVFHNEVRDKLVNRPRTITLHKIRDETGLSIAWLRFFLEPRGKANPGLARVERLSEYLNRVAH